MKLGSLVRDATYSSTLELLLWEGFSLSSTALERVRSRATPGSKGLLMTGQEMLLLELSGDEYNMCPGEPFGSWLCSPS